MSSVGLRLWLRRSRWRYQRLPVSRRVRLELQTDGRQLPVLLSAIHGAGYGVQLAGGAMLFRELLALRRASPLAALVDDRSHPCALRLSDASRDPGGPGERRVQVGYDVFSPGRPGVRLPYGMHPGVYYNGAHRHPWSPARDSFPRPLRIGFYGTHDPDFYSRSYGFPGLNRSQLLASFLIRYGEQFTALPARGPARFAVSIDHRGGELQPKQFLPQDAYLRSLRQSSFVLCLPGWCMPLSHSLIEAMYCGAIPITNAAGFLHPPLRHGIEALTFSTLAEFHAVIVEAQQMSEHRIASMRAAVSQYYQEHLEPVGWWQRFIASSEDILLVNAEELSVPLLRAAHRP